MVQIQEQSDGGKTLIQVDTNRHIELQPADSGWIDKTTPQEELDDFFMANEEEINDFELRFSI